MTDLGSQLGLLIGADDVLMSLGIWLKSKDCRGRGAGMPCVIIGLCPR